MIHRITTGVLATILLAAGGTVFVRGGRYAMREDQIARKRRGWAYVTLLDKSGSPGKRINYWAYKDERPVFDFSNVKPAGLRVHAFEVPASWVHIRGLEVVGVRGWRWGSRTGARGRIWGRLRSDGSAVQTHCQTREQSS